MEIKLDPENFRLHSKRNKELIAKSLTDNGAGRSILIDSEDIAIAGSGVYEQAKQLGIPVKIIETDGTELIAVKRTDLQTKDSKRKSLALADNATSDSSEWNNENLKKVFSDNELAQWGVALMDVNTELTAEEMEAFYERDDNKKIILTYSGREHEEVIKGLKEYGSTPEQAVFNLLGL